MYRYSVDNAVTYTSEDFVLFRESPFSCWMERLSLENPDHGIPPDVGSMAPRDSIEPQDDMADTLRTEGKDVRLIDWDAPEPERRSATLEAMRKGADFIVNGQLALGPLSGAANLLMRTSGYSELGDYLYIPCTTQPRGGQHTEFRLCFLADLLHSLQGQLPPQMLVIRGGDQLVPLETENHIYHYRAVKQRFMEAMRSFRKHRMPDPAESAHFGRWSDCAHEVLKQRLLREAQVEEEITDEDYQEPMRKAAGVAAGRDTSLDLESRRTPGSEAGPAANAVAASAGSATRAEGASSGFTLAEQAHMLAPGTYKPGPGVYRLGRPKTAAPAKKPETPDTAPEAPGPVTPAPQPTAEAPPKYNRRASDKALQNLEFIGRGPHMPGIPLEAAPPAPPMQLPEYAARPQEKPPVVFSTAPAPSLREPRQRAGEPAADAVAPAPDARLGGQSVWDIPLEDKPAPEEESVRPIAAVHPGVDMDSTHLPTPPPVLATSDATLPTELGIDENESVEHGFGQAASDRYRQDRPPAGGLFSERFSDPGSADEPAFSDSLITSNDYDD